MEKSKHPIVGGKFTVTYEAPIDVDKVNNRALVINERTNAREWISYAGRSIQAFAPKKIKHEYRPSNEEIIYVLIRSDTKTKATTKEHKVKAIVLTVGNESAFVRFLEGPLKGKERSFSFCKLVKVELPVAERTSVLNRFLPT